MMLTGEADMRVALGAVNRGQVFRFLTKPTDREQLLSAVQAGVRQHQLEAAERELLERTVSGSVRLLIDLIGLADPQGFASSSELRQLVRSTSRECGVSEGWAVELAAVLGRIGQLTLPGNLREKMARGAELAATERALVQGIPSMSAGLLEKIPRLEGVALMLREEAGDVPASAISPGAAILRICNGYLERRSQTQGLHAAFTTMRSQGDRYACDLLGHIEDVARRMGTSRDRATQRRVEAADVQVGDRLLEPFYSSDGRLLCAEQVVLNASLAQRIHNYARLGLTNTKVLVERVQAVQQEHTP